MPDLRNELYEERELANRYACVTSGNVCNARYERPAIRATLGEVRGLDVLDAGCAAGENAAWLADAGARVTALDASAAMVELAGSRLAGRARVMLADLRERLDLPDASFDLVLSSLTMHYLESWNATLREFRRVLRSRGRFVFSTHHPYLTLAEGAPYHEQRLVVERWGDFSAEPIDVRFYHRPLEQIVNEVIAAGFAVEKIAEPKPDEATFAHDPQLAVRLNERPWFLIVEARAV